MNKLLVFLFLLLISASTVLHANTTHLKNKALICLDNFNNFKSMYGFKFINEDKVQILIKNSDTVDVLVDNILKYNTSEDIIYIIGLDKNRMINYGFNIFRKNLDVWGFNVTALEPFFDGKQCEVYNDVPLNFKSFFKSLFQDGINSQISKKKI
tara:strand:+ start:114 stop:575 length:462 start_codon:yes stop_codon:yes gene_type:complete